MKWYWWVPVGIITLIVSGMIAALIDAVLYLRLGIDLGYGSSTTRWVQVMIFAASMYGIKIISDKHARGNTA